MDRIKISFLDVDSSANFDTNTGISWCIYGSSRTHGNHVMYDNNNCVMFRVGYGNHYYVFEHRVLV